MNKSKENGLLTNTEEFTMRPLKIKQDYDELIPFYDTIFEKELSAKGTSVKSLLDEMKALMPFFKILGIFSKNFKHIFDGFVYENHQGKIISTVNIGFSGNYWEIAMVATQPEYRRKGLAKKLIIKSIDHAKKYDAKLCVLEVLEENEPAYKLYEKLGFHHFDTKHKLKLEKLEHIPNADRLLPEGYRIEVRKQDNRTGKKMYLLEERITPKEILEYLPVNKIKYQKSFLMRLLRPFVKLLVKVKSHRWNIYFDNELVGILYASAGKKEKDCNIIELLIDPKHQKQLTKPLIIYSLNFISNNSTLDLITITETRNTDEFLIKTLNEFGFSTYETDHMMALKINQNK